MTASRETTRRAQEAKRLLDEPLLIEAFASIEADAIEEILTTNDDDTRRVLADRVNAIRALRAHLQAVIAKDVQDSRTRGIA
jgi:hypothetical protein